MLGANDASPEYVAISVRSPAEESAGIVHCPAATAAWHELKPSATVTVPPIVPGMVLVTVHVTVTGALRSDGSGVWPVIVVVVGASTVCATPVDVLPLFDESPA